MIYCLVAEGDSVTANEKAYPYAFAGLTASDVPVSFTKARNRFSFRYSIGNTLCANMAYAGSRLLTNPASGDFPGDLVQRVAGLDALLAPVSAPIFTTGRPNTRPTRKYILSVMIGTNQDTSNPTTHAANVGTYCLARRAAGWDAVILCTILSCHGSADPFDTTYMQPYNAIIKDSAWQAAHGVTAIADFASDSRIGAVGASDSAVYFVGDNVHPSQAGYDIMTPIFTAAVNSAKALL